MTPGLSGVKTRGRGYDRRTEQIAVCWCKQQAKQAWKYVLRFLWEGLTAGPTCANHFPCSARNWRSLPCSCEPREGHLFFIIGWGERRGLNPRPSVPQTDALPAELRSPRTKYTQFRPHSVFSKVGEGQQLFIPSTCEGVCPLTLCRD